LDDAGTVHTRLLQGSKDADQQPHLIATSTGSTNSSQHMHSQVCNMCQLDIVDTRPVADRSTFCCGVEHT
jgi:hypothetical protein